MGYTLTGYRLWSIEKQKIIISRNVTFNENDIYFRNTQIQINIEENKIEDSMVDDSFGNEVIDVQNDGEEIRGRRPVKKPSHFEDYKLYLVFDAMAFVEKAPRCVEDIQSREDKDLWKQAMDKEIKSIEKNKTWQEVNKPEDEEVLTTKWVFSTKPFESKIEDQYKARLVARGFEQCDTFDYDGIYSPVAKMTTIRMLLSVGSFILDN